MFRTRYSQEAVYALQCIVLEFCCISVKPNKSTSFHVFQKLLRLRKVVNIGMV